MPGGRHSPEIERTTLEIPFARRHDFYAGVRYVSTEMRDGVFQRVRGFFDRQRLGDNPQAELAAFQTALAVRDQRFEEICFRLVEETKVAAPGHVADDIDSGLSHIG